METLLTNKKFIKVSVIFGVILSLYVFALFINEAKKSPSIIPANSISVSGKGEVMAVSDIATLSLSLSKDATTTKEAQSLLNTQITKTLGYLKDQKIEDKDIKSEYGGINPKYSSEPIMCMSYPCPQREAKITGYTATQTITVKVRDVDTASTVRTGLAALSITNISGPTFTIDDQDVFMDQARAKAIDDAKEKAEILARQLGVHLGKVISFSDNGGPAYPMMYAAKDMAMSAVAGSAPAPELPKGENKITSNVTIMYEIR